jgi:hypothetical protein
MASSLYRLFATTIENEYQSSKSKKIFRDFVDATGFVVIGDKQVSMKFQKWSHNPYLLACDFDKIAIPVPWAGGKKLQLIFG